MADEMLNGRPAEDFEQAAIAHGRRCELDRDTAVVAGLLTEYPRAPAPAARPVTTLAELP